VKVKDDTPTTEVLPNFEPQEKMSSAQVGNAEEEMQKVFNCTETF